MKKILLGIIVCFTLVGCSVKPTVKNVYQCNPLQYRNLQHCKLVEVKCSTKVRPALCKKFTELL